MTWPLLLLLVVPIYAGSACCDRNRVGFLEFQAMVDFLHSPKTIETHFTYNNITDIYSINRKATLEFNKNHYFWDEYYEPLDERTKVCVFKLFKHHEEIEHVIFEDGSRPNQMVFGCHSDQECCEVGCCEIYQYFYFWFIYPGCTVMIIFAYLARERREREAREERIRSAMNE